jgi:hypothetical protein
MNTHSQDEPLRELLRRSWTVAPQSNPGFRAAVWARIEAARRMPATWSGWLRINVARVSYCAAASIMFAGTGGGLLAASQANRERDQLIQRYVVSIDPHQQLNSTHAP